MPQSRLSLALETGAVTIPATGLVAVFRPRAETDLSALPRDRVRIIQGFRPDHDAWAARGYACAVAPEGTYAAALVCVPRAKAEARALIAEAVALTDGPVIVDGQKTDGIDSLLKACRQRGDVPMPTSKAHGKLFVLEAADDAAFADWRARPTAGPDGFRTMPGLFSADGIDPGSALLADALPAQMKGRVADLGAGWGYLSAEVLKRADVTELHLIEAEHDALECAKVNIADRRARFHWADATRFTPDEPFDVIVTNPPFHNTRAAEPALGQAFLTAAARMLAPSGQLWLVANRHLPYERPLAQLFREVAEVAGDNAFKVLQARTPLAPRRGRR